MFRSKIFVVYYSLLLIVCPLTRRGIAIAGKSCDRVVIVVSVPLINFSQRRDGGLGKDSVSPSDKEDHNIIVTNTLSLREQRKVK